MVTDNLIMRTTFQNPMAVTQIIIIPEKHRTNNYKTPLYMQMVMKMSKTMAIVLVTELTVVVFCYLMYKELSSILSSPLP